MWLSALRAGTQYLLDSEQPVTKVYLARPLPPGGLYLHCQHQSEILPLAKEDKTEAISTNMTINPF